MLGNIFYSGNGVPQNYAETVKWLRKAADQGLARAQSSLGSMYEDGKGVPWDYVQAHMWFNLAASGFSAHSGIKGRDKAATAASGRDFAASRMTPEQIAEAQKLAREWKPSTELGPVN
jgi:uncharacterized protein